MVNSKDIKLVISEEQAANIANVLKERTKILGRVGTYETNGGTSYTRSGTSSEFTAPIYDLAEISRACDIESFVGQSVRKLTEQILKEGYTLSGPEPDMVEYIKNRLFEIALVSGITTLQLLSDMVINLVSYHNAFLVYRRDPKRSSGKPINLYGKEVKPIAAVFVPDATTMRCKVDSYGTVKKWRQEMESLNLISRGKIQGKDFDVHDVVHLHLDRKSGYTFGTPYILPVLDDIRALRKLEELVVILSSKEAFPLYHYKMGTPEDPAVVYDDGSTEIDSILGQISNLPQQGFIASSERLEVTVVSKGGAAFDLQPYLEYFQDRVKAGLRLSDIDLGKASGINRASATTISKTMQDAAKRYQQVITDCLTHKFILYLLLEGGFDVTHSNMVKLEFPPIDAEELRAKQTHGLNIYQSSAITLEEFRKEYLNKRPMSDEELNDTDRARSQMDNIELAKVQASVTASASGNKASVSNTTQPRNQFKKSATKPRVAANDYLTWLNDSIKRLKTDIIQSLEEEDMRPHIQSSVHEIVEEGIEITKNSLIGRIKAGWDKAKEEYGSKNKDAEIEVEYIGSRATDRFFKNFVHKSYWKVIDPYLEAVYNCLQNEEKDTRYIKHIEDMRLAIKNLIKVQDETSFRFGFVSYAKRASYKLVDILDSENKILRTIDISKIIYTNLLPGDNDKKICLSTADNSIE